MKKVSLLKIYIYFDEDGYPSSDWFTNKDLNFSEISDEKFLKLESYIRIFNMDVRYKKQRGNKDKFYYCLVEQCQEEELSLSIEKAFEFFEAKEKKEQETSGIKASKEKERKEKLVIKKEEKEKQKIAELKSKYERGK